MMNAGYWPVIQQTHMRLHQPLISILKCNIHNLLDDIFNLLTRIRST